MRYINAIILHSTDTPEGQEVTRSDLTRWNATSGHQGVAFHYIVHLDGSIERGRPISQPGTHTFGHNAHSIGVVYVGGRSKTGEYADTRTESQKSALKKLIWHLCCMYRCRVHGYNDFYKNSEIPCFSVHNEFNRMAERARKI